MFTIRLILTCTLAALSGSSAFAGTLAREPNVDPSFPPGPHLILQVPLDMHSLPPEITQYKVQCITDPDFDGHSISPPKTGSDSTIGAAIPLSSKTRTGEGSATGSIPAGGRDFSTEVTVGIFMRKRENISFENIMKALGSYQCELILTGTAYEVTTEYLNASTAIPLAKGAPYTRFIEGTLK